MSEDRQAGSQIDQHENGGNAQIDRLTETKRDVFVGCWEVEREEDEKRGSENFLCEFDL